MMPARSRSQFAQSESATSANHSSMVMPGEGFRFAFFFTPFFLVEAGFTVGGMRSRTRSPRPSAMNAARFGLVRSE